MQPLHAGKRIKVQPPEGISCPQNLFKEKYFVPLQSRGMIYVECNMFILYRNILERFENHNQSKPCETPTGVRKWRRREDKLLSKAGMIQSTSSFAL